MIYKCGKLSYFINVRGEQWSVVQWQQRQSEVTTRTFGNSDSESESEQMFKAATQSTMAKNEVLSELYSQIKPDVTSDFVFPLVDTKLPVANELEEAGYCSCAVKHAKESGVRPRGGPMQKCAGINCGRQSQSSWDHTSDVAFCCHRCEERYPDDQSGCARKHPRYCNAHWRECQEHTNLVHYQHGHRLCRREFRFNDGVEDRRLS